MKENYTVAVDKFAEKHFIKNFSKKYKGNWDSTLRDIIFILERFDNFKRSNNLTIIEDRGEEKVMKMDFSVAGTDMSPRASGNRMILLVNESGRSLRILLVYSKNDVKSKNETVWWKQLIG